MDVLFGGQIVGASASNSSVSVRIDRLIVQAPSTSVQSVATATADEIERTIAEKMVFRSRGRGGRPL
jgi:hypothetical protein